MKLKITFFVIILFSFLTASIGQVPSFVPTNGLLGWWPFNGNANDESGNGNNGGVYGATLTQDRFGSADRAYNFDGNDWIEATVKSLPAGNSARSVSIWTNVFQLSSPFGSAFHYGTIVNNKRFCLLYFPDHPTVIGQGNDACYNCPGSISYVDPKVTLNKWNHVVVSYNGTIVSVYINGTLSYESSKNYNTVVTNLIFGKAADAHNSGEYFIGKLDDIGLWNRALTQQEITDLYNTKGLDIALSEIDYNCSVFPNPAMNSIKINANSKLLGSNYEVHDNTGKYLFSKKINEEITTLELNSLPSGIYWLRIGEGRTHMVKFIKE